MKNIILNKLNALKLKRNYTYFDPLTINKSNIFISDSFPTLLRNNYKNELFKEESSLINNFLILLNNLETESAKLDKMTLKSLNIEEVIRTNIHCDNYKDDIIQYLECHPKEEILELFLLSSQTNKRIYDRYNTYKFRQIMEKYFSKINTINKSNLVILTKINKSMKSRSIFTNFYEKIKSRFENKKEDSPTRETRMINNGLSLINYIYSIKFGLISNKNDKNDKKGYWYLIKKSYIHLNKNKKLSIEEILILNSLFLINKFGDKLFHFNQLKQIKLHFEKNKNEILHDNLLISLLSFYKFVILISHKIEIENLDLDLKRENNIYNLLSNKNFDVNQKIIFDDNLETIYKMLNVKENRNLYKDYYLNLDIFFLKKLINNLNKNNEEFAKQIVSNIIKYFITQKDYISTLKRKEIFSPKETKDLRRQIHFLRNKIIQVFKLINSTNTTNTYLNKIKLIYFQGIANIISSLFLNEQGLSYLSKVHLELIKESEEYKNNFEDWKNWKSFYKT